MAAPAEDIVDQLMALVPEMAPVTAEDLSPLRDKYRPLFDTFVNDRFQAERRWLRNLRQYLGLYDPEIERTLANGRSKAYPRITRVKCLSVLARLMNLMFPGNERNWALSAGPEPDVSDEDAAAAVQEFLTKQQQAGVQVPPTEEDMRQAIVEMADKKAARLSSIVDDYLQEMGGDQTQDYITVNRQVVASGILYGTGVLLGPFAREQTQARWQFQGQTPQRITETKYKPQFEFLPVWDFFPDMNSKNLTSNDGYFVRRVMSRQQVRKLGERGGFFPNIIKEYLERDGVRGNYKPRQIDTELRNLGVQSNVNAEPKDTGRYEVVTWYGPVLAKHLTKARVDMGDADPEDEVPGEVWMVGNHVIGAMTSPWYDLGVKVRTVHTFTFDEDDTSPLGNGLPAVIRDSQLSVCASARMLLDNASVVCGPNLELNTDLLRPDQDLTGVHAYKVWYREGTGADAQQQAVRNVAIDSHITELLQVIRLFMDFADTESFVGPATGGDMSRGPSEPLRTAAGASMLRGDAALPFKDIVRNFDQFTQSVIQSLVWFSRLLGQHPEAQGDYNVVARGATSLIAKEIRGMQVDQLAATLTQGELEHVDSRKLVQKRFEVRDLTDMLLSEATVANNRAQAQQEMQEQKALQDEMMRATIRSELANAFKNVAQGQKNVAATEKSRIEAVEGILGQMTSADMAASAAQGAAEQPDMMQGVPPQ